MKAVLSALIAGALFGAGLLIAQMTNPAKVIAFLDVTGYWDPSLALVMGSALIVTMIGYKVVLGRDHPRLAPKFLVPTRKDIDKPLVVGAMIFGVGWGLGGLCPGPAFADILIAGPDIFYFLGGMIPAVILFRWRKSQKAS